MLISFGMIIAQQVEVVRQINIELSNDHVEWCAAYKSFGSYILMIGFVFLSKFHIIDVIIAWIVIKLKPPDDIL